MVHIIIYYEYRRPECLKAFNEVLYIIYRSKPIVLHIIDINFIYYIGLVYPRPVYLSIQFPTNVIIHVKDGDLHSLVPINDKMFVMKPKTSLRCTYL